MPPSDILKSLEDGSAPKAVKLIVARGMAPLPPKEMLDALVRLAVDNDSEISAAASNTLKGLPQDEVLAQVRSRDCSHHVLEYFASLPAPDALREAIVLNPAAPGSAIARLASTAAAPLLETILYNKARLLEFPEILEAVKLNPAMNGEIRRIVQEVETEFFGDKKKQYIIQEGEEAPVEPLESIDLEGEPPPEDLSLEGLPLDPEAREGALIERLAKMTVRQKIWQALLGTREVRAVLIRDPNKEVSRNVLRSPKLSDNEVESFAAMRSISEELLRDIGNSKQWTRNYAVVQNLVRNPKTPPMISQRMLFRLQSKDLMLLSRDRGIPEAVRRSAQRTLAQRTAPKV